MSLPARRAVTLPARCFELIDKVRSLRSKRSLSGSNPNAQVDVEICDAAIIEGVLGEWVMLHSMSPDEFVPLGPEIEVPGPYKVRMPGAADKPLPDFPPLGHVGGSMLDNKKTPPISEDRLPGRLQSKGSKQP